MLLNCEWKMSQITHSYGVKLLAWKSGGVKFLTNIMSVSWYQHPKLLFENTFPFLISCAWNDKSQHCWGLVGLFWGGIMHWPYRCCFNRSPVLESQQCSGMVGLFGVGTIWNELGDLWEPSIQLRAVTENHDCLWLVPTPSALPHISSSSSLSSSLSSSI